MTGVIKASFWSGLSTGIKILGLLVLAKIAAIYTGPEGMGQVGQLSSIMTIFAVAAGGGLSTGLVKVLGSQLGNEDEERKVISSAFFIVISFSALGLAVLLLFARPLSLAIFNTESLYFVIVVLAFAQIAMGLANFFQAAMNARTMVKEIFLGNLIAVPVGVGASIFLASEYGTQGMLVGLLLYQASFFVGYAFWASKSVQSLKSAAAKGFAKDYVRPLLSFSLMAIVTAIINPVVQISIRNMILEKQNWHEVGLFQGALRISDAFGMFVTALFMAYYLPRLSRIQDRKSAIRETAHVAKVLLPVAVGFFLSIYLAADFVIPLLFTSDFLKIQSYFPIQYAGDFVKICSWLLSYAILAKGLTRLYVISEIIFSLSLLVFANIFMNRFGTVGYFYGSLLNYILYFIFCSLVYAKIFPSEARRNA